MRFVEAGTEKNSLRRSRFSILSPVRNRFSLKTKVVSLITILAFHVVFVLPLSMLDELSAQSVPVLGSTKQFANDDLKPYVDAAKAGSTDSATFMNAITNGEQVIEAVWETSVNAEIESIVGGVTTSDSVNNVNVYKDAVRAQLELQKQQAKSQWLADANAYIQAELQVFLATLSQNTSNNVTSTNANAVQTVNPTVQNVTTSPASQNTNPAQAAQSYYQGTQVWDTKWQDLLTKQNTWEQNSLNAIQNGILQWNQSITGLENDKLAYLNGIEQTKAQWLANKQLIQNAQSQMRSALQSTITNIRNQENQLKANASSDPSLVSVFGDMDGLLDDLQDALNSNSSLGTLAETLGNFFQGQITNATAKADYWNIAKWQETYATQTLEFKKEVGTASLSCSNTQGGGNWCNYLPTGNHAVTYNADGNVYGWAATNGGFQSGVLVSSFDPYTTPNPMYQWCQQNPGDFVCWLYPDAASSPTTTVNPNASSGYYTEGHYVAVCHGWGGSVGGTCIGGGGHYALDTTDCSGAPGGAFCGYDRSWVTDQSYSTSVTESFSQAQKDQIAKNNNIRNAVLGNYNTAFGLSSQAGNAVVGSSTALETKVYLGGTALNSSNWYNSMGLIEQVQVQTKYKYIDTAMQANQNFWTSMKTQFTNIASTFLSLVNPLKDWEERSQQYEEEYQAKLLEIEQTKQSTITNYDNQINQMKAARGAWVTEVYGYQIAGIEGSQNNTDSQFRSGQENWSDTISVFQQAELNWYLSAKDTLQQSVTSPNGEAEYQTNAITQANQIQTQITNSETNTSNLYNAATGLYQTYQYAAAGNVMQQAITNLQNQTNWNQQGANLSQTIADSFGRSEAYKTAELNASNRINALAQTIYGSGAYIVDNTELNQIQNQITTNGQNQNHWQNEINGNSGGFNFNGRRASSISTTTEYTNIQNDISVATTLQEEVVDEERGYLKTANEYFEKSEKYEELAQKAKSEAKFDEAALYTGYAVREKGNAITFLKKKYNGIGEEITNEVDNRGLTYTRSSFLSYRDTLLNKNFQNSTQVQKQIQEGKNQVAGIITEGETYNQVQGMIQSAQNLNQQGVENKERVEKLLAQSKELAEKNIGEGLLDGLQEMIASIQSSLPQEVSANGVSQYIQAQEKELAEKQEKANELLSHMNSLVTNNNDLSTLQTLLQGSSQALNIAANSAVSKYLDDCAKKLQKDNEERSSNLQKTLLESLTNGDDYKYLRDAGYGFRVDGEGITAYREIYSGEIAIDGSAMKSTSYSPDLEYQYIRIETKFNPGNLSVDIMDPNSNFDANKVADLKNYIDNLQKNVEAMFAQFSNKTNEIKEEYVQNKEIESYQKKLYEASKENYLAAFQALPGEFKGMFEGEMGGLKNYHEQGSKYNFGQGSFNGQSGDMKKVGKSMYDGVNIDDTVFAGSRELKGSVSVKGIPVEVSYGMQYLIVTSGFDISNLGYNFKLKGLGTSYVDNQLSGANQRYEIYKEDIQDRIERQAKSNDAEKESKGFIFTILNGMNGGSGSMGQRFTQAVRSEAQSRITGAVAEATGLPASLVGALVGGSSMKDAVKAYVKDETTNAISKATGLPTWLISNQMEKMNKPKEQWYQSQEFQMVTTVAAVVAAPLTGGASLMIAMAVNAGLGAATGAASGGLKGALVGAVGGAAGAAVRSFTGGAVTVGLSYSAENGFGASVGVGYGPANVTVGISEKGGATVDLGFNKGGFNAGLSYNSKTGKASGSVGLEISQGSSLGISYNEGDGFGASISKSLDNGINGSLSWSEKGGVGGNIGYEVPGDKNKSKDSLANKMQGSGGSLNWSQRDGVSVAVNASGGVNAGNWSQSGGFQANTNFLNDQWKANFISGKAKEDADAQEASRAAQNKNNQETGKSVLDGAGISTQRREGEGGGISNGASSDPNNPKKPDSPENNLDERISKLKRELEEGVSLASGNGAMDESGITPEKVAAKIISQKMDELKHLESQRARLKPQSDRSAELRAPADKGNQEKANSNTPKTSGGLTEYPNGARTPIPFKEGRDGVFSEPRTNQLHGAVDLMTPIGTPIVAVADGKVSLLHDKPDNFLRNSDPNKVNKNDKGGATISIEHTNANGEKVYTYYAHNSEILVKPGQIVKKGDPISLSGQSGNTPGGPHMHFTIYKPTNGKLKETDPMLFDWNKFEGKN
ncbi:peptidoglycan DD-metalloendopeptidase family protein (plasmid) [Leptospira interrogans serovar Hardjo-prajitno]|uniref:peptidoglycan DD-metalloendopeptidase family protein n=1 Tax=Leptospira interrogans TaxID=173 RepID=UPI0009C4B0ED|nr:peptidoglycan DD-metalloendopeptidase family protein [Leptospira interrogans]OOB92549.1 peptidase M23 [Leptospira interrogans serovar Hardjo]UQX09196.1 peptidoglycan DD-metalloendopeptidase family protein [Leptospira interrogans]